MLNDLQIIIGFCILLGFVFLAFMIAVGIAILNMNSLFKRLIDLLEEKKNGPSSTVSSNS